jgi:hypothetical protein
MDVIQIEEYWRRFAEAFAHPLEANGLLGGFISNSDVTGAYAEAWVVSLAEQMVTNLTISTGTIIRTSDAQNDLRSLPQIDLVLWDHTELPALFRVGNFALVHALAARGIIEVKRSITSVDSIREQLDRQRSSLLPEYRQNVLCVVVAHTSPIGDAPSPKWVTEATPSDPVQIVRLLDKVTSKPDVDGIFGLIYFLSHLARFTPRSSSPPSPQS